MSDQDPIPVENEDNSEEAPKNENRLISPQFEELCDALKTLYVKGNQSGRIHFAQNWPAAALYLFTEDLIAYDTDGVTDKDHRDELEVQAEEKQFSLMATLDEVEEKSATSGSLEVEYVEGLIKSLGRDLSLCVYANDIVDRFIAPPSEATKEPEAPQAPEAVEPASEAAPAPEQAAPQPISQEPPVAPPPENTAPKIPETPEAPAPVETAEPAPLPPAPEAQPLQPTAPEDVAQPPQEQTTQISSPPPAEPVQPPPQEQAPEEKKVLGEVSGQIVPDAPPSDSTED